MKPEAVLEQMAKETAWKTANEPGAKLHSKLDDDEWHDGREFIEFNGDKIETLVPGDHLKIPMQQTLQEYTMKIEEVEVYDDGNITWRGHLLDYEQHNKASITRGKTLTVGGISTPTGHYTLQAHGDQGWIVNSADLSDAHHHHHEHERPHNDEHFR